MIDMNYEYPPAGFHWQFNSQLGYYEAVKDGSFRVFSPRKITPVKDRPWYRELE